MLQAFVMLLMIQNNMFSEATNNIQLRKQLYETSLNASIQLEHQDKVLRDTWTLDFQVRRVNVTSKYRVQVYTHKEHSFHGVEDNSKWTECVFLHRKEIRRSEKQYLAEESQCLVTTSAGDTGRTLAVLQVEKEIKKWRKGYRYLLNSCKIENPKDEELANTCLVKYMEKDNYSQVIQRLIILKLEAMGKLYLQLNNSLKDLEECLRKQLSSYLDKVRDIMATLNKCYSLTTQKTKTE